MYPGRNRRSSPAQPLQEAQHAAPFLSKDEHGEQRESADATTGDDLWLTLDEPTNSPSFSWMDAHVPTEMTGGLSLDSEWASIPNLRPAEEICYGSVIHTGYYDIEWISSRMNSNLAYANEKIKSAPSTMLLELQTPWSHKSLYKNELPRVMQGGLNFFRDTATGLSSNGLDVLSACALYASKNSVNGPIIMRCIDGKVNDLLASHIPMDFLPALARVQALLLYQIIRFFDGDILSRSSADATFHELRSSAQALASHIIWDPRVISGDASVVGTPILFPSQASCPIWKQWIVQESARRTYLIACFFVSVWKLVTGQQSASCQLDGDPSLLGQNWTLSAKLWQASDAVEFAVAWRESKHYIAKRKAIISTLADADGDDIEVFGKMLLTVSMGIEEAKAWLASKGTSL